MVMEDYNEQFEEYHNKLYRKRRVVFYALLVVVISLIVTLGGLIYIKNTPIDEAMVKEKDTVHQVMVGEYGAGYVKKLRNISELNYDGYYDILKVEYEAELNGKMRPRELDKKGLEVAFFVEYVTDKANRKAESLGYQEYSRDYYQNYKDVVEDVGNEKHLFNQLVEEHHNEEIDKESIKEIMGVYDKLLENGYGYLTSISISN